MTATATVAQGVVQVARAVVRPVAAETSALGREVAAGKDATGSAKAVGWGAARQVAAAAAVGAPVARAVVAALVGAGVGRAKRPLHSDSIDSTGDGQHDKNCWSWPSGTRSIVTSALAG